MDKVLVDGNYSDTKNNIIISPNNLKNITVNFHGSHNKVIINEHNQKLSNLTIEFTGDHGIALIGNCTLTGQIRIGYKSKVIIGDQVTNTNPIYITCAEETKIIIGDDCMFATNNQIRTDDAHAIFDIESGNRLNTSKDILLGAHVWIAYSAVIFGGSEINMGAIVGFNSIVKGKFPNNCTIIGAPANMKRINISWDRSNVLWSRDRLSKNADSIINKIFWDKTDPELPLFFGDGCHYLLSFIQNESPYHKDELFFNLDFIAINDNLLFLKGNAFIRGYNCYNYGNNYRYILNFKSSKNNIEIDLGKEDDIFITKNTFDGHHFSYKKSKFTTKKNNGIDLLDFNNDIYEISFVLIYNKKEIKINIFDYISKNKINNLSDFHSLLIEDDRLKLKVNH